MQVNTLETLLHKFKINLGELAPLFVDSINCYWDNRMRDIRNLKILVNLHELKMVDVRLCDSTCSSSSSSDKDQENDA